MRRVNKEFLNACRKSCTDYVHKNNSGNLRERGLYSISQMDVLSVWRAILKVDTQKMQPRAVFLIG